MTNSDEGKIAGVADEYNPWQGELSREKGDAKMAGFSPGGSWASRTAIHHSLTLQRRR